MQSKEPEKQPSDPYGNLMSNFKTVSEEFIDMKKYFNSASFLRNDHMDYIKLSAKASYQYYMKNVWQHLIVTYMFLFISNIEE